MKKILYLLTGMALIVSASCSMNKVLPYYTEPAKIATLKKGMTLPEVNNHLGISPFDVYHIQKTGGSIIAYKYRFKKRAVPYNITAPENLNIRKSQTSGTIHYEEEKNLFIYYLKGKVQSLLTGGGRADSRNVLIANNTLRLIADKELVDLRERSKLYHEGQVLHFNQLEGFSSVGSNYAPAPQFDAGINNQLTEQLQLDDFDVSPEPSNSRFSSVNSAIISESFYDQLPPGRNSYHPRRVADFSPR